jgi:hypothetical protein
MALLRGKFMYTYTLTLLKSVADLQEHALSVNSMSSHLIESHHA